MQNKNDPTASLNQVKPKPNTGVVTPQDEIQRAAMWERRFNAARDYQLPMFRKWAKWYEDMYAYVNRQRLAPWRSQVFMPIIASKVWDLISRFIQYRPGWEVSVRTLPTNILSNEAFDKYMKEANEKIEKIKMKLDYDYDSPLMDEPIQDELLGAMLDAAVTGQGLGRVPYLTKDVEYREHTTQGESIDYSKEKVTSAKEGFNAFQSINIFNVFVTPSARGLQKSPWVIIHDFVPLADLKADPKYKNLDRIKSGNATNQFAQYEAARNRLVNAQDVVNLDQSINMVEIYECWDRATNECVIYAIGSTPGTGWVEIFRGTNIYWHKKYPFVAFYIRRKPYQFWGESIFENSETLQAAANDVFNHHMDGLNMADGMIAIEEGAVVEPYRVQPGGEIRYRGEMPKQFRFTPPDPNQLTIVENLITGAVENATISQYASGVASSQTDQTQGTATGVTRMMEAAAEKVGFMRSNFRRSWREVGYMWISNTQQFMNHDIVVEKLENGEKKNEVVRPNEMMGIWNLRIDDSSFEPVSKDAQRQDYLAYAGQLAAWQALSVEQATRLNDPKKAMNINWDEVAKRGSEKFSENYAHFVLPPQEPVPAPQPEVVEQPVPVPVEPVQEMPQMQPMTADEALGALQADGSQMPTSFPIRSASNPTLGV